MTQFFATLFIALISTNISIGQSKLKFPTLTQLETYARTIKTNLDFKPIAKRWGFTFESKDEITGGTDYVYVRRTTIAQTIYTERCVFTEVTDGYVLIAFSSSRDLEALYLPAIQRNYRSIECQGDTGDKVLQACFQSRSHFIRLIDRSTEFDDGTKGNSYTIRIYKL